MRTVKLWQSCALVAGLDPDALKPHPQAWMAGPGSCLLFKAKSFPNQDMKAKFEKILRLAESAVSYTDGPIFLQGTPHSGNKKEKDVLLFEVAAYFRSLEWLDIPAALQSLAAPQAIATPQESIAEKVPATVVKISKQQAQEVRILELLRAQSYEPLALAPRASGKPGPKAEIRTLALTERKLFTEKSFEKAWERLRGAGEIAGAK